MSIKFFYYIILGLNLSSCMMIPDQHLKGFSVTVAGAVIFFIGFQLATKTNLEKWSMKILILGACIFFMG